MTPDGLNLHIELINSRGIKKKRFTNSLSMFFRKT